MKMKAYEITGQWTLAEISAESLSSAWYDDATHRWLDIEGGEPEALQELLAPFDLHPLVLEACLEPGGGGRFAAYDKELFIEFPILVEDSDDHLTHISMICLPTTLLTLHERSIPAMNVLIGDLSSHRRLHQATTSGILYNLFDSVADRLPERAAPFREMAKAIARALNKNPESVEIGDILDLKGRGGMMVDVLEDVLFCVLRLQTVESKAFQAPELGVYLRDLASTLQNLHGASQRFEARLSDLHQQFVMTQQDMMNSRLQILTVISAVFLPLTLLAGIYGMNFENMPELQESYGYPAVLGLMVMIAAVMLYVFYRRGWFK